MPLNLYELSVGLDEIAIHEQKSDAGRLPRYNSCIYYFIQTRPYGRVTPGRGK